MSKSKEDQINVQKVRFYESARNLCMEVDKYRSILVNGSQHKVSGALVLEFSAKLGGCMLELCTSLSKIVELEGRQSA